VRDLIAKAGKRRAKKGNQPRKQEAVS